MIFGRRSDPAPPSRRGSEEYGLGTTDTDRNDVSVGWARSFSFAGTVLIVGFLLVFLRSILVPFVAALFLAYLVRPLAESISACRCIPFFRKRHEAAMLKEQEDEEKEPLMGGEGEKGATPARRRLLQDVPKDSRQLIGRVETLLPKWVGVMLALILALGVIAGILAAMVVTITSFQAQMPKYRANAQVLWQQLLEWLKTVFNVDLSELQALPSRVFSTAAGAFLTTSVSMVTDLMLVVVFLAFILLQPPASQSSLRKKIDDSVSRYIILKSVISFSVAIFVYVVLAAVAFPLGLFVALATFVLNFVPSLGPTISTLLVVPIILLDDLAPYQSVIALTVPFLVHICVGNILEPWLFGQQFSMNPVIILFSLGVWYILWGTVGAPLPRRPPPCRASNRTPPAPRPLPARFRSGDPPKSLSLAAADAASHRFPPWRAQVRCWPCLSRACCASCATT
jgi:AI-2 transport protein TqsA